MKALKTLYFAILLLSASYSFAQPYKAAIGVRLGYPAFVNADFKVNFGPHWALELAAGTNFNYAGLDVAGMYHFNIEKVAGMRWYLGASVDVGGYFNHGYYGNIHNGAPYNYGYFSLGTSIFGGLEYTFEKIPLNLAFDLGPRLPIAPWGAYPTYARVGLTCRYTFK